MSDRICMVAIHPTGNRAAYANFGVEAARRARAFHQTQAGYVPTPLHSLDALAARLGLKGVLVKDESRRFGLNAFKALGSSYAMSAYADSGKPLTFVTATDGNHGRGVAWAARRLKQRAVVYMPRGTAKERLDNILREEAQAEITDMEYDDAVRHAAAQAERNGWILMQDTSWPGYTDIPGKIMQGYTTMGDEIAEQLSSVRPTHVFLQAGVGSMAGAMAGYFADRYDHDRPTVIIVEPHGANCIYRTAEANDGRLHACPGPLKSIMAGLCCGEPCDLAWDALKACADYALSCPDWTAANGMRMLGNPMGDDPRVISGESGASTAGALLAIMTRPECRAIKERLGLDENAVVLLISTEGDTDREHYRDIVWRGKYPEPEGGDGA